MEGVIERMRYYLCTFQVSGKDSRCYRTIAIDCHPVDFMMEMPELILINHIEMTQDQYNRHGNLR